MSNRVKGALYRVFHGNWEKLWAFCTDFSAILKLRTCGKCLLIHGHLEICFLNWVKIALTFWLSSSEKILKFIIFVNIQAKYKEQNEQNVVSVTEDRVPGLRPLGSGSLGSGSLGSGSFGSESLRSGSLGSGSLELGSLELWSLELWSLGSGSLGSWSIGSGSLGSKSLG